MSATSSVTTQSYNDSAKEKTFRTLQARLALRGWALTRHASDTGFWATQWGRSRDLVDLEAVESFAATVEAA